MIANTRRTLIRVRNNLWLIGGSLVVVGCCWVVVDTCVRLVARLAKALA